jgi:hypothetical protein
MGLNPDINRLLHDRREELKRALRGVREQRRHTELTGPVGIDGPIIVVDEFEPSEPPTSPTNNLIAGAITVGIAAVLLSVGTLAGLGALYAVTNAVKTLGR